MGRSVSTHRHAVATVYLHPELEDNDFSWDDFCEDLRDNVLVPRYPSLSECDRWQDREDHVILENQHVEVSVSEYCGLVAVCLAPVDPDDAFKVAFAERMANNFEKHITKMFKSCAYSKGGTMSNGESFYNKID